MDFNKHWIFKKHGKYIEPQIVASASVFWETVSQKGDFPLNDNDIEETIIDWSKVLPNYSVFFNSLDSELIISSLLLNSQLSKHGFIFIDYGYFDPILKIETRYFIDNWYDFVKANMGMGSLLCSEDYSLVIEFTNDHSYLLKSNFPLASARVSP